MVSRPAWPDYLCDVDREAMARAQRRRQALDALEFERARGEALREQLETVVAELDGAAIDEAIFASMAPEDVAVVREALFGAEPDAAGESDEEWTEVDWLVAPDEDDPALELAERESEIERLRETIAASRRREAALERYLEALAE
jgi:hypothetical protein